MDDSKEDPDLLNEETFDCAEIGDWENEHEIFVHNFQEDFDKSPAADELPKFWKDPDSLSFLWQTENLGCGGTADDGGETVVDVEATLQKLVLDETFEDPAILDISRKVPYQQLNEASFQHLKNAPAYPTAPTNIFNGSRDIWSIESSYETGHEISKTSAASDCNIKSKSIIDILHSLNVCPPITGNSVSVPVGIPVQNCLPSKLTSESQTRESGAEMYSKASQSSVNLRSVVPPYQYKAHPDTIFLAGNRVSQSQALQNHPFVHHNGTHLNHPCANSVSLDILKKQLPTDDNILPRLPLIQPAVGNMHLSHWDYSQIQSSSLIRNQYVLQQNPSITLPISSSQRNPLAGSSNIRGLMVSNIQPNLFPLLSHLSRFPIQSTNIESKQSISQPPPTISCLKQPTQLVPSTEKMSTDSESDPNRGSWMTEYEAIGVLLIQLRPLMVSNPYVQDYYFASQWLRRINAIQAKQITNGQVSTTNPPATMQLPIPIPLESLSDSNSPYQVTLKHKLVIPFSAVNLNPVLDQNVDENCDSFEKTAESQETLTSESSNALGRPTRSNVHRPRVVAELSLVSALSSVSEQSSTKPPHDELMNNQNESHVDDSFHIVSTDLVRVMTNRKRLLVLAQIERMYSLILILDEVSLSLKKVVVQNDARARLLDYQEELINQLISELFRLSFTTNKPTKEEIFKSIGENCLFTLSENLFSISKGMRLWCLTLHYLPTKIQTNYLSEFILDFLRLRQLWPTTMDKAATIFYPHLREIIYQLKCINDFLKLCFPDALKMNTDSHLTITDNLKSLLSCKLGLSLIFCLLDACARASNPTDPSDFIQFGAYFSYANSFIDRNNVSNDHTNQNDYVMEPFPHLASILMLYIKPSKYHLLTDEHLNIFCELAAKVVSISNNDIVKSTITTTNSNNMNSSSPLSNSGIESSTPFHVPVSLTQCSVTMNGNNSNNKSCYPILSSHYTQAQTTISSQNSVNVLSNIVKNSDELSSVSVVVG